MATTNITVDGDKWTITHPDQVEITPGLSAPVPTISIDFQYDEALLLDGQAHGIASLQFEPEIVGQDDFDGFKGQLTLNVMNATSAPISGWLLMMSNDTLLPADPANPTGHPVNYAHIHGLTETSFVPMAGVVSIPQFQSANGAGVGGSLAPAWAYQATGILNPGQPVGISGNTMHNAELPGKDNGFGMHLMLSDPDGSTKAPMIAGLPSSLTATGLSKPFAGVTITDADTLPLEKATFTITDSSGNPTDAHTLTAPASTKLKDTGVGTYTIEAALPASLTTQLHGISFTPAPNSSGSITLKVEDRVGSGSIGLSDTETTTWDVSVTNPGGQIVRDDAEFIIDANGHKWTIVGGQVAMDGVVDANTQQVVCLVYDQGNIWQQNSTKAWWFKNEATPSEPFTKAIPPFPNPPLYVSADQTVLDNENGTIVDQNENVWSIFNDHVYVNGIQDQTTNHVTRIVVNGNEIWHENTIGNWYSKTSPGATWQPEGQNSPIDASALSPMPLIAMVDEGNIVIGSDMVGVGLPSFLAAPGSTALPPPDDIGNAFGEAAAAQPEMPVLSPSGAVTEAADPSFAGMFNGIMMLQPMIGLGES
ncbi:MAG: hypothetical protein AB7F35_21500 [Acetobacteraceae bacterium]